MENLKKREWIKNAIIIFLVVMLILTLFSNTIMNYSLPEVSAQYTSSGQITNKVRGTGVVETADPYSLVVKEARKISAVKVRPGDTVEIGDVIYELDEAESEELKEALDELKKLEDAYESKIITSEIERKTTAAVATGSIGTLESNQAKLEAAKNLVESWEKRIAEIEKAQTKYEHEAEGFDSTSLSTDKSAWEVQKAADEKDYQDAKAAYDDAVLKASEKYIKDLKDARDKAEIAWRNASDHTYDVSGSDPITEEIAVKNEENAKEAYYAAEKAYTEAEAERKALTPEYIKKLKDACDSEAANYNYSSGMVNYYNDAIKNGTKEISDKKYNYSSQLVDAKDAKDKAEKAYTELKTELANMYGLESDLDAITKQKEKVEKLRSESIGAAITAPVAGTIITVKNVAGETTEKGAEVATIQRAGKGFTMSLNITKEQAKFVSVGDEADVANSWWYSDIHARVREIRPDQANPNGKIIIFEVEGEDLISGTSLNVSVGNKTANYDIIVPNSALGEDSKGKYVYKVDSKSTPFGNRYIARKVYVTILAESDTESAVSGDLIGWDYVVTTSSKPFEDGQQIRLKD
jgi:multidrug efflux pump subunit AcrA (membrane-fusion protein)